ncbi:MAG TPA: EcsC family protein [Thermoanaerobaculia bacterium]|nr:EcsC family protein [Thermoanaerobaculia bacterium]
MGRVRMLRRRADSMLEDVFHALFEEVDREKLRREIAEMRAAAGDSYDAAEHARALARRTAIRCAAAGAVSGLPAAGLLAIGTLGADLAYLTFQQFRMIVGIAMIYGHEPSGQERFAEALSCLAYTSGAGLGKQGLAAVIGSAESGIMARKIGARLTRNRLARFVPLAGMVSGCAVNYAVTWAVARAAVRYYDSQIDPSLAEEIWAEGDREHA